MTIQGKQSSDSSYDCVAYDLVKNRLSESQAEAEEQNQSFPFCFWGPFTKQPTMHKATTGFLAKWSLWNECENSVLMTRHYPDLGSAGFWLVENLLHGPTFIEYRWRVVFFFRCSGTQGYIWWFLESDRKGTGPGTYLLLSRYKLALSPGQTCPGYQRLFSRTAGIFGVGRRPTHLRP